MTDSYPPTTTSDFDPDSVPIKPAVSVLLIRDNGTGLEVFVQHRVSTMDFAAGAVVFPGGRVDPVDESAAESISVAQPQTHRAAWAQSTIAEVAEGWRVLLAAAVREVEEETGARLDPAVLRPWANWVTPLGMPKRFDTYFFLVRASESPAPHHRTTEAHRSEWTSVSSILAAAEVGELSLMRPTLALLNELNSFATVAEACAHKRNIDPVRPESPAHFD